MLKVEEYEFIMRKVPLVIDEFYHIFNRGVDRRTIFVDDDDALRFYVSLSLFNDVNFKNPGRTSVLHDLKGKDLVKYAIERAKERVPLVHITSFTLLPNHFHLKLKQAVEHGISIFLHKLSSGFAHYFNKRHERSGRLFQGVFKSVLVERDAQLFHLPCYIHLNTLDMTDLNWRDGGVIDWPRARRFMDHYKWTSHGVYMNKKQLLPVVNEQLVRQLYPSPERYLETLKTWSTRRVLLDKKHLTISA